MTTIIALTAGIDICKDRLDVALHPSGETRQFANDRRGHGKLLRWLGKRAVAHVVFEATGSCGRELERQLEKSAVPFARVNPSIVSRRSMDLWKRRGQETAEGHARRFAEATGRLAKTDRVPTPMRRATSGPRSTRSCSPALVLH